MKNQVKNIGFLVLKKHGSNAHWAESVNIAVDEDAKEEYERIKKDSGT